MENKKGTAVLQTSGEIEPSRPALRYVVRGRMAATDRGPLPAGHLLSWGAITEGTVLAGAEYPFPVFQW